MLAPSDLSAGRFGAAEGQRQQLTCLHLVGERLLAVLNELLQVDWLLSDCKVEHSKHLFWLIKVDHLLAAVVFALDIAETDFDDLAQKLLSLLVGLGVALERQQILWDPTAAGLTD